MSNHTSWETFQGEVRKKDYQRVITGRAHRDLAPIGGEWSFKKLDPHF